MFEDDDFLSLEAVAGPDLPTLLQQFASSARERGERYARQQRVGELIIEADPEANPGWNVDGDVRGTTGHDNVLLDLARDLEGQWWFGSECDCPVGWRCKHAVAVLHVLAQEHPEMVPRARPGLPKLPTTPVVSAEELVAQRWLGQLRLVQAAAPKKTSPFDGLVYFELTHTSGRSRGEALLSLTPARCKILKKTGLPGKLQSLGTSNFYDLNAHRGDPELWTLLQSLEAMQHLSGTRWNNLPWGVLAGALARPTLERALASGRVVQRQPDGTPSEPWQWGPPRQLGWVWQEHGDGFWQLQPSITGADGQPASAQAFVGQVSLYLDDAARCVGELDLRGVSDAQVQQWLGVPPLPEAWLRRQPELRQLLPTLPTTVAEPVLRCIRDRPPRLLLKMRWPAPGPSLSPPKSSSSSRQAPRQAAVAEVELWFNYDGLRCAPWPAGAPARQFVPTPDGLVELQREPETEQALARTWAAFATPLNETDPRYLAEPHNPPHHWQLGSAGEPDAKVLLAGWLTLDFAPLRQLGFELELDEQWLSRTRQVEALSATLEEAEQPGAASWLDLSLGFVIDGQRINLLPLLPQVLAGLTPGASGDLSSRPAGFWVQSDDGLWWHLPSAPLRPWLEVLIELLGERAGDFHGEALSLSPVEALRLGADQAEFGQNGHAALREVMAPLQAGALLAAPPPGLQATLRPYQHQGWLWMQALAKHRLGGVLADDMGLGKTLQTLTHLLHEKLQGRSRHPSLVVAPTSLVGNWRRECERFTPQLRLLVLHGTVRHAHHGAMAEHDVVLTTYPLLQRDIHVLSEQPWHALVLDEAQNLKNARTQTAKAARQLYAQHRIALTGTPMENHLGELWSLLDLVLPGYLGREARFTELYRTPIEKQHNSHRLALLRRRLTPFMLRRDKSKVAAELPPKIEQIVRVQLGASQANLYETIRAAAEASVHAALVAKGLANSHIMVLDALLKLRQACCDPRLVELKQSRQKISIESAKLSWLLENLPQMVEEGRRVLLFSQFTSMLALIEAALSETDLRWTLLTGDTTDRDAAITRFTSGEVPLFLISLKAGGTGLNLPQADTVIHFDPWWNPAVESQATDRAHRLGQTQTVFVYKLVAEGTLEERILGMQARKAELARSVQGGAGTDDTSTALTQADLDWLLRPLGAATLDADLSTSHPNSLTGEAASA